MQEYTLPMALMDYLPVILFFLGTQIIARDLKHRIAAVPWWIFTAGILIVTIAGGLKATFKLLHALQITEAEWMADQFFFNHAFGFMLAGIGLTIGVTTRGKQTYALLSTMSLVAMIVIGTTAMDASLCWLANKLKKRSALICFIISYFMSLGMGYLSSRDFSSSSMNWIAQIVNLIGQLLLYLGCRQLHEAGLRDKI